MSTSSTSATIIPNGPPHVVLLGDSIFDNEVYVGEGNLSVLEQMVLALSSPENPVNQQGTATLLAQDGAVIGAVEESQLVKIPADATHLVLSVGGNNALKQFDVFAIMCLFLMTILRFCLANVVLFSMGCL